VLAADGFVLEHRASETARPATAMSARCNARTSQAPGTRGSITGTRAPRDPGTLFPHSAHVSGCAPPQPSAYDEFIPRRQRHPTLQPRRQR